MTPGLRNLKPFRFLAASLCLALLAGSACTPAVPGNEVEAQEYLGTRLTPLSKQRNNALKGTQHIDRDSYRLIVDGQVDNPLSLSYSDLTGLPEESRLVILHCVEGWDFVAKWTGPTLESILDKARPRETAKTVVFHTADASGYTSLELDYILDKKIIIALKLNDVTLPPDRGFPFQVVAEGKFGYKWAKWVERIELVEGDFRGYWESVGYNNNADIRGPAFEPGSSPFD